MRSGMEKMGLLEGAWDAGGMCKRKRDQDAAVGVGGDVRQGGGRGCGLLM